ncbi:MAG: hypothetical protein C4523_18595 [Myxococcales bacterium]|nr:MAG: hypothetical protein C4523_18595 [Myxococcales bacterium]
MDRWSRRFWALNAAALALRLLVAAALPLTPDEAYYWLWSKTPAWGYYDHPPMVAWWIAATTSLFGDSPLAVRLAAPLAFMLIAGFAYHLARRVASGERAFLLGAAIQALPLFNLGGVILTPDTPLIAFWCIGLFVVHRLWRANRPNDYVWLGVVVGLGLLSKYTMILFPVALLIALGREWRERWRGFALAAAVALAILIPHLSWSMAQGWTPLVFQWRHGTSGEGGLFENIIGFAAAQIGLFTPGFVFLAILAFRRRRQDAEATPFGPFVVAPLAFFLPFAMFSHAEAGWAAVAYPAALWLGWRYAARLGGVLDGVLRKSIYLALVLTAVLYAWAFGLFGENPVLTQGPRLTAEIGRLGRALSEDEFYLPLVAQHYRLAAWTTYNVTGAQQPVRVLPLAGRRGSEFDIGDSTHMESGFIWIGEARASEQPPPARDFDCAYADELWPTLRPVGDFRFLVCRRSAGLRPDEGSFVPSSFFYTPLIGSPPFAKTN